MTYSMRCFLLTSLSLFISFSTLFAQEDVIAEENEYVFKQSVIPKGLDNYQFSIYYFTDHKVFNLLNTSLCFSLGKIKSFNISPNGNSYAILTSTSKNRGKVIIYDLWTADKFLHKFRNLRRPTAVCFTPDDKVVIASKNKLLIYGADKYKLRNQIEIPFIASHLDISNNNCFIAAADDSHLIIWDIHDNSIIKQFNYDAVIQEISFSPENNYFGVLTDDGRLTNYETADFEIKDQYDNLQNSLHFTYHPEEKYVSVLIGNKRIAIINLYDKNDRNYIDFSKNTATCIRFIKDNKGQSYLVYNTLRSINYRPIYNIAPNYTKLVNDELNLKMEEWSKQLPDETLEAYNIRVNETTKVEQQRLFEEDIATRLADNLLEMSEVSFGNYNPEANLLAVEFNTMPTIYLEIPKEDLQDFRNPDDLEFKNEKYGITVNDKFELVYADVHNNVTDKTYTFDNRKRESLAYLEDDENFIPLAEAQKSVMEMLKLEGGEKEVVESNRETVSNHAKIAVKTHTSTDYDADGNKINNYNIDFSYNVDPSFSFKEDFAPGQYKVGNSGAALAMLDMIKKTFSEDFAKYIQEGKKLQIKITGTADAIPIKSKIYYDGCFGILNKKIYVDNVLKEVSISRKSGITTNEQLALLRATNVQKFIEKNIPELGKMDKEIVYYINLNRNKGGKFRRIAVEFKFIDTF